MKKTLTLASIITVFLVLGVMYRPVRMLCLCISAVIAAELLLHVLRKKKQRGARIAYMVLYTLSVMGLSFLLLLEFQIVSHDDTDTETPVSAVVILGAGVNGTEPSLSLYVRLTTALDYIEDKPDVPIVVTGGKGGGENITEAQCMSVWLTERGIDESRIYLEEQATNTRENVEFSQKILKNIGVDPTDNVAVVTSNYHLYRASLYWGEPWMVPVAAKMPTFYWPLTLNYYIREAFAVAKLLVLGG